MTNGHELMMINCYMHLCVLILLVVETMIVSDNHYFGVCNNSLHSLTQSYSGAARGQFIQVTVNSKSVPMIKHKNDLNVCGYNHSSFLRIATKSIGYPCLFLRLITVSA